MTKAQALAAAAVVLEGVDGANAADHSEAVTALAAAGRAFIELGNAIGDNTLTWDDEAPRTTGELISFG